MGLKQDLIDAKLAALKIDAKIAGATEEEIANIVPSEFIIVGGTGNLSKNKILPALFWRFLDKQIDEHSNIILCDKEIKSKDDFFSK